MPNPKKSPKKNPPKKTRAKKLDLAKELRTSDFRVTIFGSARIIEGDKVYKQVFELAKMIGKKKYDIITGGGPGLMEAANRGHVAGDTKDEAESIGLNIELPFEQKENPYVEFVKHFQTFSERLKTFTELSHVFVITPGGVGTMLEFFFTWQLLQVGKMAYKPIILIGKMWEQLVYWVIDHALKDKLISSKDFDYLYIVHNNKEAMSLINKFAKQQKKDKKCHPIHKREVDLKKKIIHTNK
jgi:uncharacterized protein (TIGR00730 family)